MKFENYKGQRVEINFQNFEKVLPGTKPGFTLVKLKNGREEWVKATKDEILESHRGRIELNLFGFSPELGLENERRIVKDSYLFKSSVFFAQHGSNPLDPPSFFLH